MVTCSTWSRDEAVIYSGGFDGSSIKVWKVGKRRRVLPCLLRCLLHLRLAKTSAPAPIPSCSATRALLFKPLCAVRKACRPARQSVACHVVVMSRGPPALPSACSPLSFLCIADQPYQRTTAAGGARK